MGLRVLQTESVLQFSRMSSRISMLCEKCNSNDSIGLCTVVASMRFNAWNMGLEKSGVEVVTMNITTSCKPCISAIY